MSEVLNATRVLIVDDEADYASSTALLLKKHGYDSHMCIGSEGCLAAVERLRPQVILLDLAMPGLTGLDLAQKIRENPNYKSVCLVAVTGRGQDLDRMQTKVCGFNYHLLKPLNFQDLDVILKSVI